MKIFAKLTGAFAIVALICAIVGALGWVGINSTENGLIEVAEVRLPAVAGLGQMLESMNAIKSAERTMMNPILSLADRQHELDNLKERWAEFEAGEDKFKGLPKTPAETALMENFLQLEKQWRGEHAKLVELVSQIKLDDVQRLESILVARQLDHIKWVAALDKTVAAQVPFSGQLDPTLCGLGKWMSGFTTSSEGFSQIMAGFAAPHERLHGLGAKINQLIAGGQHGEARAIFNAEVKPTLEAVEAVFGHALADVRKENEALNSALAIGFGSEHKAFSATMKVLEEMVALNTSLTTELTHSAEASASRSKYISLISVLLGIAAALGFGFVISRGIAGPMNQTVRMLHELDQGHLGSRLKMNRQDEIGQMANAMDSFADSLQKEVVDSLQKLAKGDLTFSATPRDGQDVIRGALKTLGEDLNGIMAQIQTASEEIASGSGQVSDSSQSLSQGATESASSLEEISSSMTEMGSQVKRTAENASQASLLSAQAKAAAENGNAQMQSMVSAMGEINESGQSISKIIKVIDEIAFQTNLLALNAAVEAARAGQHGKGFAVVAEEVRNLAARSAKAAEETSALIEGSVKKAENGAQIADKTAAALSEIVTGVTKVTDLVAEIAAASNEQAQGISQVSQGLSQIDSVTQQNTAAAEQSAAAAEELSSQAAQLRQMLTRFTLKQQGQRRSGSAAAAAGNASQSTAWGVEAKSPAASAPMIALDDDEFGRY